MSQIKYFIAFVYLAFISVPYVHALPDSNTIEFDNCTISLPGTTYTTRAQCGWLDVAEDHDKPDDEKIRLHIALATAVSRTPDPDREQKGFRNKGSALPRAATVERIEHPSSISVGGAALLVVCSGDLFRH